MHNILQSLGMLEVITCQHAISLLECLKVSFKAAEEFDQKPGLKFLIQKILGSDVSANLYRHGRIWFHCLTVNDFLPLNLL